MKRRDFTLGALGAVALAGRAAAQDATAAGAQDALVAGAKAEGAVSYWDAVIQPETNDLLVAAFLKQTGLPSSFQVNYTLLSTANLVTRVEQELAADRITVDVAGVAAPSWVFDKAEKGAILHYDSPEYAHYGPAFEHGLGKRGYFAFNGSYVFIPMWSSDNLRFSGSGWRDVLGAVPEGRMSIGDATNSASYLATFIGLRRVLGDDYFRSVAKLKPKFLVRSEQICSRLVEGQDLMALFGQPTRALQNNERGASIKFIFPKEGVVLMPQCMFIPKDAPHPNAAKLWMNFMLGEEAQSILAKREAMSSGRAGFVSPDPDYAPNIEAMKLIDVDWQKITEHDLEQARTDWRAIFAS